MVCPAVTVEPEAGLADLTTLKTATGLLVWLVEQPVCSRAR